MTYGLCMRSVDHPDCGIGTLIDLCTIMVFFPTSNYVFNCVNCGVKDGLGGMFE